MGLLRRWSEACRTWREAWDRKREIASVRMVCARAGHDVSHWSDEHIERKLTLLKIRKHFEFFGHDVSDLSDEDLEQGAMRIMETIRSLGMSQEQVLTCAQRVARVSGKSFIR